MSKTTTLNEYEDRIGCMMDVLEIVECFSIIQNNLIVQKSTRQSNEVL